MAAPNGEAAAPGRLAKREEVDGAGALRAERRDWFCPPRHPRCGGRRRRRAGSRRGRAGGGVGSRRLGVLCGELLALTGLARERWLREQWLRERDASVRAREGLLDRGLGGAGEGWMSSSPNSRTACRARTTWPSTSTASTSTPSSRSNTPTMGEPELLYATSSPITTRRQRRARCSSGHVPCLLRLAAAATQWPGSGRQPVGGVPQCSCPQHAHSSRRERRPLGKRARPLLRAVARVEDPRRGAGSCSPGAAAGVERHGTHGLVGGRDGEGASRVTCSSHALALALPAPQGIARVIPSLSCWGRGRPRSQRRSRALLAAAEGRGILPSRALSKRSAAPGARAWMTGKVSHEEAQCAASRSAHAERRPSPPHRQASRAVRRLCPGSCSARVGGALQGNVQRHHRGHARTLP